MCRETRLSTLMWDKGAAQIVRQQAWMFYRAGRRSDTLPGAPSAYRTGQAIVASLQLLRAKRGDKKTGRGSAHTSEQLKHRGVQRAVLRGDSAKQDSPSTRHRLAACYQRPLGGHARLT